jgi:hypothetical protein
MKEIKPHRSVYDLKKSPPYEGPYTSKRSHRYLDIPFAVCIGICLGMLLVKWFGG